MASENERPEKTYSEVKGVVTREKAVEILSEFVKTRFTLFDQDLVQSVQLGIHAIEMLIQAHRGDPHP